MSHIFLLLHRDGTSIVLSDDVGQIYLLNTGQGESQKDAKLDQVPEKFIYIVSPSPVSFVMEVGSSQSPNDNCFSNFFNSSSLGTIVPLSGILWEMFLIRLVTTYYYILVWWIYFHFHTQQEIELIKFHAYINFIMCKVRNSQILVVGNPFLFQAVSLSIYFFMFVQIYSTVIKFQKYWILKH